MLSRPGALRAIQQHEKMIRRTQPGDCLPYSVLLTRTNSAIRARALKHIESGLIAAGIPVFNTELNEREAFKAMFEFREPLEHLGPSEVANLDKAIANAEALTKEVIDALRKDQTTKPEAA